MNKLHSQSLASFDEAERKHDRKFCQRASTDEN